MSLRSSMSLVAAAVLLACKGGDVSVHVALPRTADPIDSMVVIVEPGDGAAWRIFAHAYPIADDRLEVLTVTDDPSKVTALYSLLDLDDLGLPEGEIALGKPGRPSRSIPSYHSAFSADVSPDGVTEWRALDQLDPSVQDLSIDDPNAVDCADMLFRPLAWPSGEPTTHKVAFAVQLDADSALVATSSGSFFRVTERGAEPIQMPVGTPHKSAWRTSDGTIWLFGEGGAFARTDASLAVEALTPTSPGPMTDQQIMDGSADPPLELFTWADGAWRFADGDWTPLMPGPRNIFQRALFLERGRGLFGSRDGAVLRYRADREPALQTEVVVPDGPSPGPMVRSANGAAYVSFLGAGVGEFYREDTRRGTWERVVAIELPSVNSILMMAPRPNGFIFGGGSGAMGEIIRGASPCPLGYVPSPNIGLFWGVDRVVTLGPDQFLLVADAVDSLTPRGTLTGSALIWLQLR